VHLPRYVLNPYGCELLVPLQGVGAYPALTPPPPPPPPPSSPLGFAQEARVTRADYVHADSLRRNNVIERLAAVGDDAVMVMTPRTLANAAARREREKQSRLARDLELQVCVCARSAIKPICW
jgi:hypothetical protein